MFLVLLFSVVFSMCCGDPVIFGDCGSKYELQFVAIEGCEMQLPCYLTVGEEPEVTVVFTADFSSNYLGQDVVITLNFVNLRTNATPEPCASTGCPVSTSRATHIVSKMFVPRNMALNQRGTLSWKVYNENNQLVLCYNVMVETQSALQKMLRQYLRDANATSNYVTRGQG